MESITPDGIMDRLNRLETDNLFLRREVARLDLEIVVLKKENETLKTENTLLNSENTRLGMMAHKKLALSYF